MQTVNTRFTKLAIGQIRPLTWAVRASFDKTFNEATDLFTLDVSTLDGMDILAPSDDNPVQAWDKYSYDDFKDRAISIEVVREETEPYSVTQAYADITLNNYDGYFTPGGGSPIDRYILPRRPFRAYMGFGTLALQQLVGLSDNMPELDKSSRTASFHIIDFLAYLLDRDIGETIMLENVKTHEVLAYLLEYLGLSPDQYNLDGSVNTISFFYVEKDTTFGSIVHKLMEAEIGAFYLDETGVIRFKNRYNFELAPVYTFDKSNTLDYSISDQSMIINSVKITGDVREVQSSKSVGTGATTPIDAGDTVELFINFEDPVTTVSNPVYSAAPIGSSYFTTVLASDGTTPYTSVSLSSLELFSKSAKLTFANSGASDAIISDLDLYGTPAEVVESIDVTEVDQDSIDKFEEQIYTIDNEYIQDANNAQTRAVMLLRDYKDYGTMLDIEVKGNPALQLGDAVNLDLDGFQGVHVIKKLANAVVDAQFKQKLRVLKKEVVQYFILDSSTLNGADLLSN